MISRRKFLLGCAGAMGLAAYGRYFEPGWFEVTRREIPFFKVANGEPLRVLFLADFHYSSCVPLTMISEAIKLGLAEKPDLILLGGDQVLFDMELDFQAFTKTLSPLAACAPTFACYGNHDRKFGTEKNRQVTEALVAAGVRVLFNRCEKLAVSGREFELIGMGDLWSEQCDVDAFPLYDWRSPTLSRLVLAHNPDCKDVLRGERWELMLCGHTHGGQVRVPLVGAPFAPVKDKRFIAGLNEWEGRRIYTTRGVGNLHGVRFNCRPEVTVLELL